MIGYPRRASTAPRSAPSSSTGKCRCRQPCALPQQLAAQFVHTQRRCADTTAGVGLVHHFQQSLNGAVLATTAMQNQEGTVKIGLQQLCKRGHAHLPQGRRQRPSTPAACNPRSTSAPLRSEISRSAERPPMMTATRPKAAAFRCIQSPLIHALFSASTAVRLSCFN